MRRRLDGLEIAPESLDAILVSHEHGDHCRGLAPLARRCKIPVYLHHQTLNVLPELHNLPDLRLFDTGDTLMLGDVCISPFATTHDAVAPVGYTIEGAEGKVGIATDLGLATRLVTDRLQGCRALVLETNHDEQLLRDGPYPWPLKQRIRSRHGHLSNTEAAELLQLVLWEGLEALFLAHMSETNNRPELALGVIGRVLGDFPGRPPQVIVGHQHRISACFSCQPSLPTEKR